MEEHLSTNGNAPAYYNRHLLIWRRESLGLTSKRMTELMPTNRESLRAVFRGIASYRTVYAVAEFLGLDWAMLHSLTLSENDYPLAVRRGAQLIAPASVVGNSAQSAT